jgi:xyloglucan-specific exo-beta-1,4-glucanase
MPNTRTPVRLYLVAGAALLFAAVLSATPAVEDYAWRNVSIRGGGYVSGLVFHPTTPDLLYARTDVGGAYRWDPTTRSWRPLNDAIDRAHGELNGILSVALDPSDPERVYLAAGSYLSDWAQPGAVLRSTDRGATWAGTPLPFKLGGNENGRGTGERLAVDPHDGRVLLLGSNRNGLWRSRDSAKTWTPAGKFPDGTGITFVLFDPASGTAGKPTPVIYLGLETTTADSLYRSTDAGKTWAPVPGQPAGLIIHHAALNAQGTLYLAGGNGPGPNDVTAGGVWKFDPRAARWTDLTPVRPNAADNDRFGYAGLALDPRNPGTLLVSTLDRWSRGDEIFRSTDDGATWQPLLAHSKWNSAGAPYVQALKPHWISDVAIDPFHPERAWFVTGYGLWATDQVRAPLEPGRPITWVFPNKGLEETVIDALISPPAGASLLSALGDLGGFRHDDLAVSPRAGFFQPLHSGSPGIDFAEQNPAVMVRTHFGPARGARSTDGGATWANFTGTPPAAVKHGPGIAALSADGRRIVWLPKGSPPFFSTDDGATWTASRTDLVSTTEWATYGPVADRVNPQKFYVYDSVTGAFFASADGAAQFTRTATLPPRGGQLRAEPGAEGHIWVPTAEGLFRSTDSGRTFARIENVPAAYQVGFGAAAPGRTASAVFLDGRVQDQSAFFRSDDSGATWIRISDDRLRLGWLRCLTGDPRVFGRVYLGTSGRGILVGEPAPAAANK